MIYFGYIIIFLLFLTAAGVFIFYSYRRIVYDHFQKICTRALLTAQNRLNSPRWFSSRFLNDIIRFLFKSRSAKARRALLFLCCGKTSPAEKYLADRGRFSDAAVLGSFLFPKKGCEILEKLLRKTPDSQKIPAELAKLYFALGQIPKTRLTVERIDNTKADPYSRGVKSYFQAYFFLQDGDMLTASESCSLAITIFNRQQAAYEEAQSYLLMGTIYRVSCIEDVAQFMFGAALKIFGKIGDAAGEAEALGNLGMLFVLQERFAEAEENFQKALEINLQAQRPAAAGDINNQLALMQILKNDFAAAEIYLDAAAALHGENPGNGFTQELRARAAYGKKDLATAALLARQAAEIYKGSGNVSAYFESLYLQALALFELGQPDPAEQILRDLLTFSRKKQTSFHVANAYNLLGLIYLQKEDLQRARGFFQEGISLEQKNERYSGAATDYANIGLVERKCGHYQEAAKNLEKALELSAAYGETELSDILQKQLAALKLKLK